MGPSSFTGGDQRVAAVSNAGVTRPYARMMRALIVVNPAARGGANAAVGEALLRRMTLAGWTAELQVPESPEDTRALLAARTDVDAVIVAGGDGTVGIAVQELVGGTVPLGIIPTGTGNDFATAFGLHTLDVDAAIATVLGGHTRTVDLGIVSTDDGRATAFASVLATGFDSLVNDRANRMRWPRGRRRYDIAILIEYLRLRRLRYDLDWIDEHGDTGSTRGVLLMASVANSRSYGGGIPISPESDPTDGLLELVTVRPAGRLRLLRVLAKVFKAAHLGEPEVRVIRVREVTIAGEPDVRGYADGDPVGSLPLRVRVLPAALRIFTPAASDH